MIQCTAALLLYVYTIAAGPLAQTVLELAEQSHPGCQVVFFPVDLPHLATKPVYGLYTEEGALCEALRGTGWTVWVRQTEHARSYNIVPGPDCARPKGWGPEWIRVPQVEWK